MSTRLAVVNCGQLVTLAGPARPRVCGELKDLAIVSDAILLVRDGRVECAGPAAGLEARIGAGWEIVDAGGRVVLPGFVDAHTHPVFAGIRADEYEQRAGGATYETIAAAGGGIRSTVRKTRAATEDELLGVAQRYANWFLRSGTTTIEAKSGYGLSPECEFKLLRVIRRLGETSRLRVVPTFLGAHEVPDEYRGRRDEYVALVTGEMLSHVARERLARYCDAFCEPGIFDLDCSRAIMLRARELGLGIRLHADQFRCSGGAVLAAELGAATADHLEHVDAAGITALARAGVQPVLLPGSVFTLGGKYYPPARAMIDAGLAVVLATDFNPGSSPIASMPLILSLACTHMHMTPAEAVTAATVNAAWSLGLGSETGSLEPGKSADFVIHDCEDYREIPYFAGIQSAARVFTAGVSI